MDGTRSQHATNWVTSLRGFLGVPQAATEHCDLCHAEIGRHHAHLMEPQSRRFVCACPACALLFFEDASNRYRRVPDTVMRLHDFKLSDTQWDAFLIPINMAFFFRSAAQARVLAMYPGPAGATESLLDLQAWNDLSAHNPLLDDLQDDVEALLINRVGGAREYYRVPIDRCYELVGVIRSHWHGISGGQDAREAIQAFFSALREETGSACATNHGGRMHA